MSTDTLVNADTGEVIAECTPAEAREMTDRIKTGLAVTWDLIVDAYRQRAWAALGHASWDAYTAAEFPSHQLRLPREERAEVIASLREAGLSIRAIAATGVASKNTVERTIAASGVPKEDTSTTGTDGKTYDAVARAKANRPAPEPTDPGKCTDGFDCPATPGPDGLCAWHRGKQAADAGDRSETPLPVSDEGPQEPSEAPAAPTPDRDVPPAVEGQTGSGEEPVSPDELSAARVLPADHRARIARACQLLGCPADLLAAVLTADDVIDLTDLRNHLNEILEQTA